MKKILLIIMAVTFALALFGAAVARFSFEIGFQRGASSSGRYAAELLHLLSQRTGEKDSSHPAWKVILEDIDKVSSGDASMLEVIQELEKLPQHPGID